MVEVISLSPFAPSLLPSLFYSLLLITLLNLSINILTMSFSSRNKLSTQAPITSHLHPTATVPTYTPLTSASLTKSRNSLSLPSHAPLTPLSNTRTSSSSSHHTNLYAPLTHVLHTPAAPPLLSSTHMYALPVPLTRTSISQAPHRTYTTPHHTLDSVLEKVNRTLNENAVLRERAQRNFPDLANEADPNLFERSPSPILPQESFKNRYATRESQALRREGKGREREQK